jgi:hypothetical protein
MALQPLWTLAAFSVTLIYTQPVGLLGLGISTTQGRCLHTEHHTHTEYIHSSNGIRTQDPSVGAGEDGSCLRSLCHCDRLELE